MKSILLSLVLCSVSSAAERVVKEVQTIEPQELMLSLQKTDDFRSHAATIRRGLNCTATHLRARAARWFATNGTEEDIPYLIDALSDKFGDGVKYRAPDVRGMETTCYWANVALIVICKTSYDFRWDSTEEDREQAILLWQQHWNRVKPKKD